MFGRDTSYPTAVASYDDEGVELAIQWSLQYLNDDEVLTVWTYLVGNLRNCRELEELVRHPNVRHATGRNGSHIRNGPVIMAWPDMDDIGAVVRSRISSLCVIAQNEDAVRSWVSAVNPTILGDGTAWETTTPDLDPVVVQAMKSMTLTMNHNNTISGGYEKDNVVGILLALHAARLPMYPEAMQGWALANGWSGDNPKRLARYVKDINSGKRPRTRSPVPPDFIDRMRDRAEGRESAD